MKVLIYAPVDVFYYSYYIEGLYTLYGKKNVKFSSTAFPVFYSRVLAIIIKDGVNDKKIIIDALDSSSIFEIPLEWCHFYGKVNYNEVGINKRNVEKIIPIGPSFGIKIWSFHQTIKFAIINYFKAGKRIQLKKYYFTSYWRQFNRLPLREYNSPTLSQTNYIYFISSLWKNEDQTNRMRAIFIRTCKKIDKLKFEGGFAPRSDNNELGYRDLIDKRITPKAYLKKIKESILVFNTPAVQNCHGWKLPEFLALGKAIISTSHINQLPIPLDDQSHLHYVSDSQEDIEKAILKILEDSDYRHGLEFKSKEYFNKYLAPHKVLKKILDHLNN